MFGESFLVAPVTSPEDVRDVYLPEGQWFDFWTGKAVNGGRTITRQTPVDEIPVYVKAGTVLPVGPTVQYALEKAWDDLLVRVYPGADGEFVLYEDAKDGYAYEDGGYTTIRMTWNDKRRELTIHDRQGNFPEMLKDRVFRVILVGEGAGLGLDNESAGTEVRYTGSAIKVAL